jgi:hypothetical protein
MILARFNIIELTTDLADSTTLSEFSAWFAMTGLHKWWTDRLADVRWIKDPHGHSMFCYLSAPDVPRWYARIGLKREGQIWRTGRTGIDVLCYNVGYPKNPTLHKYDENLPLLSFAKWCVRPDVIDWAKRSRAMIATFNTSEIYGHVHVPQWGE